MSADQLLSAGDQHLICFTTFSKKFNLKAVTFRILVMTLPTDILHRATFINFAMDLIHNHGLMALPTTEDTLDILS
jgi:hypothetical protein